MYVLPGGEKLDISSDDMSEVQPGVKKTELKKSSFGKMSSGKRNSRPVLNKFVGMIDSQMRIILNNYFQKSSKHRGDRTLDKTCLNLS